MCVLFTVLCNLERPEKVLNELEKLISTPRKLRSSSMTLSKKGCGKFVLDVTLPAEDVLPQVFSATHS